MDRTIELLKEAQARIQALLSDYEMAMAKFREGFALLAKHMDGGSPSLPGASQLSDREREIFVLTGQGLSSAEIAARLSIAPKTVNAHRDKIRKKLGFKNVWELAEAARKQSLMPKQ